MVCNCFAPVFTELDCLRSELSGIDLMLDEIGDREEITIPTPCEYLPANSITIRKDVMMARREETVKRIRRLKG